MNSTFEQTSPRISRWSQDGAEYVRSTTEWIARFARHLVDLQPGLNADIALDVAQHASLDDDMRALSPEFAVDELAHTGFVEE